MSRVGKNFAPPILGLGLLFAACHPTGAEYVSDLDVVATTHDATFDFATPSTYSRPDRIYLISGDPTATPPDRLNPQLEQLILNTLDNEMNALGYTLVSVGQTPDLVITAGALKVTNVSYYYGYWCGYWAYYYPCYPYYPAGRRRQHLHGGDAADRHGAVLRHAARQSDQGRVDGRHPRGPDREPVHRPDPDRQRHLAGIHPVSVPGAAMRTHRTLIPFAAAARPALRLDGTRRAPADAGRALVPVLDPHRRDLQLHAAGELAGRRSRRGELRPAGPGGGAGLRVERLPRERHRHHQLQGHATSTETRTAP